ncbi:MAG: hypothetical protein WC284_16275 [Candidimonas sp.]
MLYVDYDEYDTDPHIKDIAASYGLIGCLAHMSKYIDFTFIMTIDAGNKNMLVHICNEIFDHPVIARDLMILTIYLCHKMQRNGIPINNISLPGRLWPIIWSFRDTRLVIDGNDGLEIKNLGRGRIDLDVGLRIYKSIKTMSLSSDGSVLAVVC